MSGSIHLENIIQRVGLAPLASNIGVSYQAIQKYLKTKVPSEKVLSICQADEWKTSPHQLRPDLYPHPHDGLPEELRDVA